MNQVCLALALLAGCPLCDGPDGTGNPVKEAVFGPEFWPNLMALSLPFALALWAAALIRFVPTKGGRA